MKTDGIRDMANEQKIYDAWREHEAYAVPVTEEGERKAARRWESFKAGWIKALEQNEKDTNTVQEHM